MQLTGLWEVDSYLQLKIKQHCLAVFVLGNRLIEHPEKENEMILDVNKAFFRRQIYEMRSVIAVFE